jgi:putative ABC transport system permease protein
MAVRWQTGWVEATRMVAGRRPASGSTTEATLSRDAASALGVGVGDRVVISGTTAPAPVLITGVFEPITPDAPIWADMTMARTGCPSQADGLRYRVTLLTDAGGADLAARATGDADRRWRYRLDDARITAADVPALVGAVQATRREPPADTILRTNLDASLSRFDGEQAAVRSLLAVSQAGILSTLLGLILLAARLAVDRRRDEYALIRARGGSAVAIGARALRETLLAVPAAVAAGALAGAAMPGRSGGGEVPAVLAVALVATLAVPICAVVAARHPTFTARRRDLARERPSPRRLTAELSVVLLAVLGLVLLRRRGLDAAHGVDPYLVVVPVLLAVAAALIALHALPWPLAGAGRLVARSRSAVGFLGLNGAARGAPLTVGPLAALVVAVATGVFTSVVVSTIGHARDTAAHRTIPLDATVTGYQFAPGTAERIAELPGVTRAVPVTLESGAQLNGSDGRTLQAQVMVVDATAAWPGLPEELTAARPGDTPAPAVASPEVAAAIPAGGTLDVQGRRYPFRVATVRATVPGIEVGTRRFLILPQQAMGVPAAEPLRPSRILLAGDRFDPAAVVAAADAGQRAALEGATGVPARDFDVAEPAALVTRQQYRAGLENTGVNAVLTFTTTAAVLAAVALTLAVVGFAVIAGAPARGRMLSLLRTMGLSRRQGRRLLVYELTPMIAGALLAGALTGVALPALIGPALGLSAFTAGVPARIHLDPVVAGGILLVAALAVAVALVVEDVVNRRRRLGTVLRLGEEN